MGKKEFSARFWGARGAVSAPGRRSVKYGGNTSCVEVHCASNVLIFDAGSGLRPLGLELQKKGVKKFDLFFTHFHYDHICGLPFFAPLYDPECEISIWSGHLDRIDATRESINDYMTHPFFPVGPEVFKASINYRDFCSGDILNPIEDIELRTCPLNHPGGATAYRINFDNRSICYVTDTEHERGLLNETIVALVEDADVMIYDATYSDTEYPNFVDFGHSTWEEGIRLCCAAGVKKFGLFHHRPSRTDAKLDLIEKAAKRKFAKSFAAREGLKIKV